MSTGGSARRSVAGGECLLENAAPTQGRAGAGTSLPRRSGLNSSSSGGSKARRGGPPTVCSGRARPAQQQVARTRQAQGPLPWPFPLSLLLVTNSPPVSPASTQSFPSAPSLSSTRPLLSPRVLRTLVLLLLLLLSNLSGHYYPILWSAAARQRLLLLQGTPSLRELRLPGAGGQGTGGGRWGGVGSEANGMGRGTSGTIVEVESGEGSRDGVGGEEWRERGDARDPETGVSREGMVQPGVVQSGQKLRGSGGGQQHDRQLAKSKKQGRGGREAKQGSPRRKEKKSQAKQKRHLLAETQVE